MRPFRTGPTPFLAVSPIWWQARHFRNTFSPAAASCANDAPVDRITAAPAARARVASLTICDDLVCERNSTRLHLHGRASTHEGEERSRLGSGRTSQGQ